MANKTPGQRLKEHFEVTTEGIRAEIGKINSDGSYTVRVPDTTNEVYVRIEADARRTVQAINLTTQYKAKLPVRVRLNASKRYEVIGIDSILGTNFLGEAAPAANLPPMATTDDVNAVWTSEHLKPGRVRPLNGTDLQAYVEKLPYGDALLGDTSIDLATAVGTITSSTKAPIVISVDPTDNTLTTTKGTEVGLPLPITLADALAVTVPTGDVRLWAYILMNTDTALPTNSRLGGDYQYDLRQWITVAGGGAAADAHYLTSQAESGLSNEVNLGALTTGLLKHTVSAGVSTPATAAAGADYTSPTGTENLSNKTITASSLNSSPVGASSPSTGAFTDLSATTFLDLTEASTPATPTSNHSRSYLADDNGFSVERFIESNAYIFQRGRDSYIIAKNISGGSLSRGEAVTIIGSGGVPAILKADATNVIEFAAAGLVIDTSVANNSFCVVQTWGVFAPYNTTGIGAQILYLSPTTPGGLVTSTTINSNLPTWIQQVAVVLDTTGGASGTILICPKSPSPASVYADVLRIGSTGNPVDLIGYVGSKTGTMRWTSLGANRTWTLPDETGTVLTTAAAIAASQLGVMTGDSGSGGAKGAAPAPSAGDAAALKFLKADGTWAVPYNKYCCLQDQQAQNTAGGGFTSGAWQTRTINTKQSDSDTIASILKLPFTSGGTYEVVVGDTITGATSGATATVFDVELTSGSWGAGTAAGNFWINSQTGTFSAENLNVGANTNVATIAANSTTNQIRLKTGTYRAQCSAPAYKCGGHQTRLQNITDTATTITGTSEGTATTDDVQTRSFVIGQFTIAANKTFELQHRCVTTRATNGFGLAVNLTTEVYAVAEFTKVA